MQFLKKCFTANPFFLIKPRLYFSSTPKFKNFSIDEHNGVHINDSELPTTPNVLSSMLSNSLIDWKSQKISGVWLKLPKDKLYLLESALSQQFELHHCSPNYIMLTIWLRTDVESKIPYYSTHYVGCGGLNS